MSSGKDPFGFERPKPGYSPKPITITVQPGQEIRIIVADSTGTVPGAVKAEGDDTAMPSRKPDDTAMPSRKPDRR